MSAPHQPFPIADFSSGMYQAKQPWLSPSNAFRDLRNARIYRGRMELRPGFSYMSDLGTLHAAINGGGTGPNSQAIYGPFTLDATTGYLAGLIPGSAVFSWTDASSAVLQAKLRSPQYPTGPWDGNNPFIGVDVVDYATGLVTIGNYLTVNASFNVNWAAHPGYTGSGASRGTMSYYQPVGKPVTGIGAFKDANGNETVLACDRNAVYVLNPLTKTFQADASTVTLTGSDTDYFWFWPFDSFCMLSNNVDPVLKFTPGGTPTIQEIGSEFDSTSSGNDLDTCLIVVRFGGRAVFLNTKENGTRFPRRARWTVGGNAFEVHRKDGQDFTDAPSNLGSIVTADFIGERLFVGFENGWMELVDTGFSGTPGLTWRPTVSRFGATSKLSTIRDSEKLLSRSLTGMQAIVGDGQAAIDSDIPDVIRDQGALSRKNSAGIRNELGREFLWTFAAPGATVPNRVLAAQYSQGDALSWSIYEMQFNVWGQFFGQNQLTIDQLPSLAIDSLPGTIDQLGSVDGSARLIGGANDGRVYVFDGSFSDTYLPISLVAISESLIPFPTHRSNLGWIDIYGTAADSVSITVSLLADDRVSIHKASTVSLKPSTVSNAVYRRILFNRTAAQHRIRIDASSNQYFAIDAIIPWFRDAGRIKKFG